LPMTKQWVFKVKDFRTIHPSADSIKDKYLYLSPKTE